MPELRTYDSGYEFEKHPVIRLDMSSISSEKPEILKTSIASELRVQIRKEGLDIANDVPSDMFKNLILGLHDKTPKQGTVPTLGLKFD